MSDRGGDEDTKSGERTTTTVMDIQDDQATHSESGQMSSEDQLRFSRGFQGFLEEMNERKLRAQRHPEANVKFYGSGDVDSPEILMTRRAMAKINNEVAEMLAKYRAEAKLRKETLDAKSCDEGRIEKNSG